MLGKHTAPERERLRRNTQECTIVGVSNFCFGAGESLPVFIATVSERAAREALKGPFAEIVSVSRALDTHAFNFQTEQTTRGMSNG